MIRTLIRFLGVISGFSIGGFLFGVEGSVVGALVGLGGAIAFQASIEKEIEKNKKDEEVK